MVQPRQQVAAVWRWKAGCAGAMRRRAAAVGGGPPAGGAEASGGGASTVTVVGLRSSALGAAMVDSDLLTVRLFDAASDMGRLAAGSCSAG